ncbi:MAG: transcription elongation factor GreA [Proteobacteria bacterium]|nr:transcription elongation factor GreA [Pseudomonadota bacterium]
MTGKVPMTREGYESLLKELKRLKEVERPKIIKEIAEARSHGDLSENAEYDAAKEKQGMLEKKIGETEDKIAKAQIIESSDIDTSRVVFGVSVQLKDEGSGDEITYRIVGADESDVKMGKISVNSPLARALIGREVNDLVEVKIPGHD